MRLVNALAEDIKAYGGTILTKHQVISIQQKNNSIVSVEVVYNCIKKIIECDGIINASGPLSSKIANLVNQSIDLQLTKGSIIAFSHKIVSQPINRCRIPSSNDIMCPYGDASLWGTTSEVVEDPNTLHVRPEEIRELLSGAEKLL